MSKAQKLHNQFVRIILVNIMSIIITMYNQLLVTNREARAYADTIEAKYENIKLDHLAIIELEESADA